MVNKIVMNKNIIIGIVVLLVILGCLTIYKNTGNGVLKTSSETTEKAVVPNISTIAKEFTVTGNNFSFSPSNITVKKGNTVKIIFKDDEGYHDLKIDGYNVATERVQTGQEGVVTFVADKVGSFEYYCTVNGHKEKGMKGTLVVVK